MLPFILISAFYKQHGYSIQVIHPNHETTFLRDQIFLNQQSIQLKKRTLPARKNWNEMFKQLMPVSARFYQVQITQEIICPIIYSRATNDQSYAKVNSSNSPPIYHIQGNKN